MKIEILGTGCAKCRRMLANVQDAVKELGVPAEIVKVEDITEIMNRGVMLTPALIVDGEARVGEEGPPRGRGEGDPGGMILPMVHKFYRVR